MLNAKSHLKDGTIQRHPKLPDGLERFRQVAGSIRLKGDVPSEDFIDERSERWLLKRASD